MNIMGLVGQIALDKFISSGAPVSHKSKAVLGFFALAGFFLFLGFVFLLVALNQYLITAYEPHVAALITGAVCFILALLGVLGAYLVLQFKKSRIQRIQTDMMDRFNEVLDFADDELSALIKSNPKALMIAASLAGIILGRRYL
jgi:hypothetical protein